MNRLIFIALLSVPIAGLQDDALRIDLPPEVIPELVDVDIFLRGSFGGYGGPVERTRVGRTLVVPVTNREGYRATSLRAIVFSPGCSFQKIALDVIPRGDARESFVCRRVPSVPLRGTIASYNARKKVEVRAYYIGAWQKEFFGYIDGSVPQYMVAKAEPDESGEFRLEVPDYTSESRGFDSENAAWWQIRLFVDGNSGAGVRLPIQSSYSQELRLRMRE